MQIHNIDDNNMKWQSIHVYGFTTLPSEIYWLNLYVIKVIFHT